MSFVPYEPDLRHICGNPDFCSDRTCRVVECKHCHHDWPCSDYRAVHSPVQIAQQLRWAQRVQEQ